MLRIAIQAKGRLNEESIGLLAECHSIYAIPLSVSSKNPFFDRVSTR